MKNPKVEIEEMSFSENAYKDGNRQWRVTTLLQYIKEQGYEPFKLPLAGVDLSYLPWTINSLHSLLFHLKRINDCSTDHPVLIDDHGLLCDGSHRILKAILNGETEIDAIRIQKMPPPDEIEEQNK